MSRVVIDARALTMYPPLTAPFHGATEMLLKRLARALAKKHDVHILSVEDEQVVDGVTWWPGSRGPRVADTLITFGNVGPAMDMTYKEAFVFQTSPHQAVSPREGVTYVAISDYMSELTKKMNPSLFDSQLVVIKPGVNGPELHAPVKIPHRLIYCNSPDRGLIHLARMWPRILERVPGASIRVTYGVDTWLLQHRLWMDVWGDDALMLEHWIADNPESVIAGRSDDVWMEQELAELYAMPFDPMNVGDAAHTLAGMECASAGCAMLLSYHEGLPEIFGEAADFLGLPINQDDWVEQICDILTDEKRMWKMQYKAIEWARTQPWSKWEKAWLQLVSGVLPPTSPERPAEPATAR